jgi:hypothetical protein
LFPDGFYIKGALIVLLFLVAAPTVVMGQELKLTPSLAVQEEYNDNIFLASGNSVDDFITTLTPALDLSSRTERRDTDLSGGVNWLKYARHSESDAVDYFVNGTGGFRIDERLAISVGGSITQNSRPDQLDPVTGLSINSENRTQNCQAGGSYMATEKSKISLNYSFIQQDYSLSSLLGNRLHQASAALSYTLAPQTSLDTALTFNRELTDISKVDNYYATLGLSYKFKELWRLTMNAGGIYSNSDLMVAGVYDISNGDWGWVGNLSFIYSGEKLNGTISFNRNVYPAAGLTGSTESTGGSLTLGGKFTYELSGSIDFGYYWNKSNQEQFSVLPINEKTLQLTCLLHYDFNKDLALEANYHYLNIEYGQLGTRASQNIYSLRLTMRHDLFL